MQPKKIRRVIIMGAAGRDFHNFNMVYRDDAGYEVVAFTAAQIPGISDRRYPAALSGANHPDGIPIVDESQLDRICRSEAIDEVAFSYSDITHEAVMRAASRVIAAGADFRLLGPRHTMIEASVPVIAISAVRTGCGKSQVGRWLSGYLEGKGLSVAVIRHPMPYGDLEQQAVQRFATRADLVAGNCTIEEREEYEPHIAAGHPVFAGVDYARIVQKAQNEGELILWEGGNNDYPFVQPDLHIVLVDALRPGHVTGYHPGEAVLQMADVVVIAKSNSVDEEAVEQLSETISSMRPGLPIVRAASPITLNNPDAVRGRRTLVIEDGPTITHGDMAYGAGFVAAQDLAAEIIDPRKFATPNIAAVYRRYPHIGPVLPAVGYDEAQRFELERTIARSDAEVVVIATPIDLGALLRIKQPTVRARYDYGDASEPRLAELVDGFINRAASKLAGTTIDG